MPKDMGYSGSGKVNRPAKKDDIGLPAPSFKSPKGGLVNSPARRSEKEQYKSPGQGGSADVKGAARD